MEYAFYFNFFISLWIMQQNLNNYKIEMKSNLQKILIPVLVILHSKSILIQAIQATWIYKNHFFLNVSKHKSINIQLTFNQNQF